MAMTAPLTPSRFGHSIQHGQSLYGANDISMADSLPSVDFGFDELRERMAAFTARFDDFIAKGRKRVLDERNAFRMSTAELQESKRHRRQAILDLEQKSNSHADTVAKEAQETEELQTAIATLKREKEEQEQRRAELQEEVQSLQVDIKKRKEAQQAYQRAIDEEARNDIPELRAWEDLLGLSIEGTQAGSEVLRFIFNDIDARDRTRTAWFDMDFAVKGGAIVEARPKIPVDEVARLEQAMGESRDFGALLKGMRDLFVVAMK